MLAFQLQLKQLLTRTLKFNNYSGKVTLSKPSTKSSCKCYHYEARRVVTSFLGGHSIKNNSGFALFDIALSLKLPYI